MAIHLENLSKQYAKNGPPALANFDLALTEGELLAIVGPSGSGKTTLLNLITGFEVPTSGKVWLDGQDITNLPPKDRQMALVFQDYALFPQMTVAQNITFGLKVRKVAKAEQKKKLAWVTDELGLTPYLDQKPGALSGGQRQRVALARAMVREPKLFLMDEPLSNLDAKLREQIGQMILSTHQKIGATTLFVTHSQAEAMSLADRVAVLKAGVLQQVATPKEIYQQPANLFVARFIGSPEINVLPKAAASDLGISAIPENAQQVAIRSEDLLVADTGLSAQITSLNYLGASTNVQLKAGKQQLVMQVNGEADFEMGQQLKIKGKTDKWLFFDENDQRIV